MVISDEDFKTLHSITCILRSFNFQRITALSPFQPNILYYLAKAIIDLEELITNKNNRGYRYNSYVTNMAFLKLTFINELIIAKSLPTLRQEHIAIEQAIKMISHIISVSYKAKQTE